MSTDETNIRFLNPPSLFPPPGFSHVAEVRGGRLVFIAGQVAFDQTGTLVGAGDFRAQAEQVFQNLQTALRAVGAEFGQVVKLNIYVRDMGQLRTLAEVRDRYVDPSRPPASTAVEVSRLARDGLLLEVEAVAVLPDSPSG